MTGKWKRCCLFCFTPLDGDLGISKYCSEKCRELHSEEESRLAVESDRPAKVPQDRSQGPQKGSQ